MQAADLELLLSPLQDEAPSGSNLEYDPDFLALERAAAPKAEKSIGSSVIAAEEPDWEAVAALAMSLSGRTKDLRIAMHLATAWLRTQGIPGWASGLALVHGLVESFWDSVHPQLDADDDDDPTFRVNSVAPLGSPVGTLQYFRNTPFVQSQRLGRFSLRDLRVANGTLKIPPPVGDDDAPVVAPPTLAMIEACCKDCPEQMLVDNTEAIGRSLDHAKAIDRLFTDRLGANGPDLKPMVTDIFELKKFLDAQLAKRRPPPASAAAEFDDDDEQSSGAGSGHGVPVRGSTGRIASTRDVIQRIDELCDYYAVVEPSSPVPLLLRRAQRLVGKDFLDLLKDLAPGGIAQLQVVSGTTAATSGAGSGSAAAAAVFDDDE